MGVAREKLLSLLPPRARLELRWARIRAEQSFGRRYSTRRRAEKVRRSVGVLFLRGHGIEVGALHRPVRLPHGTSVRYVDRYSRESLREHYPELAHERLVAVDVLDDGEALSTIPDGSLDFVIANHFIEHCEDPLGTVATHLRKLGPDGVLYYCIPDRCATVDRKRSVTPFEHLLEDHREGPGHSRRAHYGEWARLVLGLPEAEAEAEADRLMADGYSIHFHVWDADALYEFVRRLRLDLGLGLRLELLLHNDNEIILVLRRYPPR
jgi:SAM-dependent methyltransferase